MSTSSRAALASALLLAGCYESHALQGLCDEGPHGAPAGALDRATVSVEPVSAEAVLDESGLGSPLVAWDGASWNVAWGARFAALDAAGRLRGAVEERGEGGDATALEAGGCQRALTAASERPSESLVAWIGMDGVLEGTAIVPGVDADVARGEHGWWIASDASSLDDVPRLVVLEADPGSGIARPREWISEGALTQVRVVGASGVAAVSWVDRAGIVQRAVGRTRSGSSFRVMTANVWALGALETAVLRRRDGSERVVVAATDGSMVHVALTDPAARAVVAGPVAVVRTTAQGVRPGVAPMPELDAIALCVPSGPGPWGGADVIDRISVIVLDRDAAPMARVDLAEGASVHAVDCAWNGRELMVVSSRSEGTGPVGIVTQRLQVGSRGGPLPISEPW